MTKTVNGKEIAAQIRQNVKKKLKKLDKKLKLAVILVSDDPASVVYVKMKEKACVEAGIDFELIKISPREACKTIDSKDCVLTKTIQKLNWDKNVTGILVQLPLPRAIDENAIISRMDPAKDVDCLHPFNFGNLFLNKFQVDKLAPCTPKGCLYLLKHFNFDIESKNAVIVGRSNIAGKPMARLLLSQDATVSVCHSKTKNLKQFTKKADILVTAVGIPNFIKKDMVKKGAFVIDVGINRVKGKLVGDVNFDDVKSKSAFITPVPGGVGPMTVAMLLENILICHKLKRLS
ncbi:MAG: bifunctional methylenetetrahydrofolate dehydrogenase/methenyltetrahydrofolate cyclohydrolase [Candidatus Moranbacteria bacterium]|nr:bifunctional methylenetetrahydrofolate dehydrogenase/methenyltetrahydrofolate cyclohydrolase [Candidatus Moranbacteria bacterium]